MAVNIQDGLREIETAKWVKDEYNTLNLYVHTKDDHPVHCFLTLRPNYCDRGHIQLNIDGPLYLDSNDSFPRFFFSFAEADMHTRTFLKWRLWKHRTHAHVLEGEGPIRNAEELFPFAWSINDKLRINPDQSATFEGSTGDVEVFREILHKLDPNFNRGH